MDILGDATVNVSDLAILGTNYRQSWPNIPGDLNGDDVVNVSDLAILGTAFRNSLPPLPAGLASMTTDSWGDLAASDQVTYDPSLSPVLSEDGLFDVLELSPARA